METKNFTGGPMAVEAHGGTIGVGQIWRRKNGRAVGDLVSIIRIDTERCIAYVVPAVVKDGAYHMMAHPEHPQKAFPEGMIAFLLLHPTSRVFELVGTLGAQISCEEE